MKTLKSKKIIISILAITISSTYFFTSCVKDCSPDIRTVENQIQIEQKQKRKLKIRGEWHWKGVADLNSKDCSGEPCGSCGGICVYVEWEKDESIALGTGTGDIDIPSPTKLSLSNTSSAIDNGNGTVTITENFPLSQNIADHFGYEVLLIKKGVYLIDYSTGGFGECTFDIETNDN